MAEQYKNNFKCVILSPNKLIYENEINSISLDGDKGEFELLAYHYPLLGVVNKGPVIINGKEKILINGGVVRFMANECTILVEEDLSPKAKKN